MILKRSLTGRQSIPCHLLYVKWLNRSTRFLYSQYMCSTIKSCKLFAELNNYRIIINFVATLFFFVLSNPFVAILQWSFFHRQTSSILVYIIEAFCLLTYMKRDMSNITFTGMKLVVNVGDASLSIRLIK